MSVRAIFSRRDGLPDRLVAEGELCFAGPEMGILDGMKLVGFCVWQGADGDVYATFPSRAFGVGSERRYFDYLRPADGDATKAKALKAWIIEQYRAWRASAEDLKAEVTK